MTSSSGRYVLAYNGEIYNHLSLRRGVERARSVRWRGSSDSESLLEYIDLHGLRAAVSGFSGMFAFALVDRAEQVVHLVRDRFGEKPLYFAEGLGGSSQVAFASEPQALFELGVDQSLDPATVASLVLHGARSRSAFVSVSEVGPGTIVSIDRSGNVSADVYWSVSERFAELSGSRDKDAAGDLQSDFAQVLTQSVREQLLTDVPLGAFLSGGVDSSLIVAVMSGLLPSPVKTFTVGFGQREHDETPYARVVANYLGTEHHEMIIPESDVLDVVEAAFESSREPFADPSMVPTLALCRFAREQVTVVLTGDGADELFFGYRPWVKKFHRMNQSAVVRGKIDSSARSGYGMAQQPVPGHRWRQLRQRLRRTVAPSPLSVLKAPHTAHRNADADSGDANQWADLTMEEGMRSLATGILQKVDRAAMSASLETRAPFLAASVAEFAMAVPVALKVADGSGKFIVREQLKRHLPAELVDRPKQGFTPPLDAWLRGPLREMVQDMLSASTLRNSDFFRAKEVHKLLGSFFRGEVRADAIWRIVAVQAWLQSSRRLHHS